MPIITTYIAASVFVALSTTFKYVCYVCVFLYAYYSLSQTLHIVACYICNFLSVYTSLFVYTHAHVYLYACARARARVCVYIYMYENARICCVLRIPNVSLIRFLWWQKASTESGSRNSPLNRFICGWRRTAMDPSLRSDENAHSATCCLSCAIHGSPRSAEYVLRLVCGRK